MTRKLNISLLKIKVLGIISKDAFIMQPIIGSDAISGARIDRSDQSMSHNCHLAKT